MRVYLSEMNLRKAAVLAALVTLMTVPRLIQGDKPLGLFLPLTFITMMLVGGIVTAWGRYAGMPGFVTDRAIFLRGVRTAAVVTGLALPLQVLWVDPVLRSALAGAADRSMAALSYPVTVRGCLALMLWSAGFQAIFLQAAPMSFFTRLTRRPDVALCLCLTLRVYIAYRQMALSGMTASIGLFIVSAVGTVAAGCFVFARFGLGPTLLLAAGMDLHLFFARSE
jgi:hypothetical protein